MGNHGNNNEDQDHHSARLLAESNGFTLIEIMVVIIILGLLADFGHPKYHWVY